ncbi:MAG: hypothetical protein AAGI90_05380 [Chlamydiota bacterium]
MFLGSVFCPIPYMLVSGASPEKENDFDRSTVIAQLFTITKESLAIALFGALPHNAFLRFGVSQLANGVPVSFRDMHRKYGLFPKGSNYSAHPSVHCGKQLAYNSAFHKLAEANFGQESPIVSFAAAIGSALAFPNLSKESVASAGKSPSLPPRMIGAAHHCRTLQSMARGCKNRVYPLSLRLRIVAFANEWLREGIYNKWALNI